MATLNVLFLGETNLGENSIVDLITGPAWKQESTTCFTDHRLQFGSDVPRSVTLDSKTFILHAPPTNESMYTSAPEGIQNILVDLRRTGGVHLFVYCMNALHSTSWIHDIHCTVISHSAHSTPTPTVAVVSGLSDVVEQENWWSSNEDVLVKQGLRFDDHAFIPMMASAARSLTGDHISESRHILHALVLQNCNFEPVPRFQYPPLFAANSFHSLVHMISRKSSSCRPASLKVIDIVLLGEIGVGKSTLINLVVGKNVAEVSSDTIACTTTADKYTIEEKGRTFHLHDTPGLVDPQMGVRAFIDPIDTIQKKIRSIGNGSGPNLLLFCIDNKPTAALQRDYRLFSKIICGGKVPCALAVTKLREGENGDQWWGQHKTTIRGFGVDCLGHVGLPYVKKHLVPNVDLEELSRESLLMFFITCADRQKQRTGSLRFSMGRAVDSFTTLLRSRASTPERILMNQCMLEEHVARELVSRLVASE